MGAIATFNFAAWGTRFPEFSGVSEPRALSFWTTATMFWPNNGASPSPTVEEQANLLNLLTAHIAALSTSGAGGAGGAAPIGPVGRISSATEGSVTVQTELAGAQAGASPSMAFYAQTQYGLMFWQATAGYRNMHYRVAGGVRFPRWR